MEQRFSPEFAKMYEQSHKVRVGDIELGRDLAEETNSSLGDRLATLFTIPVFLTTFVLHGWDPLGGIVGGLVTGEVLRVLSGGIEVERSKKEDIYQKEY